MRKPIRLVAAAAVVAALATVASAEEAKLKVLVVTGGHDYEPQFHDMWRADPGLVCEHQQHPKALETICAGAPGFDVVVLYDMYMPITDAQKEGYARTFRNGKPLVVLHHALANFKDWPEYRRMIGGRYFVEQHVEGGATKPASTYEHDLDLKIEVADREHYITRGLADFQIHDEAYGGFAVDPGSHPLLRTSHPKSGPVVAWTRTYGKARVAVIQLGHDSKAYTNPSYRTLVSRAVLWAGRRTPEDAGFGPVFNGKDLAGWKAEGDARFSVEDGILVGRQGPGGAAGDLFSEAEFGDFDCEVSWAMDWPGNSGVWFRYVDGANAYQADILEIESMKAWSGSIYVGGRNVLFVARNEDPSLVAKEGWNSLRIRCQADHLEAWLNDTKVADLKDPGSRRGRFGLQVHAGADFEKMAIRIADLRVKKL